MNIDIIIPIYNAFDFVQKCIESVIAHTDLSQHTLILVNDKSSDERITPWLHQVQQCHPSCKIVILENNQNMGFVGTVNIGIKYSEQDVILLNSDTEVTHRWIEKIQACANSQPLVATVTPLSNNATLASVPEFMAEGKLPEGFSLTEMAELVETCSLNLFPEIPTANGFCMFIKREAIRHVGLFDAKTFEKGYGEENDFCYRCLQAGYRHLLCDNTYIYHKGSQSFSEAKLLLIESHLKILKQRYPACIANTERFVEQNPLYIIQENIRLALGLHHRKNILMVIHDFKQQEEKNIGGTTLHVHDLISQLKSAFNFHVLYFSETDKEHRITSYLPTEVRTQKVSSYERFTTLPLYHKAFRSDIAMLTEALHIDLIHVHHLKHMYLDLFEIAHEKKIPVLYTLHDYYSICPSTILKSEKQWICSYTNTHGCDTCLTQKMQWNANANSIPIWRQAFQQSLHTVQQFISPSASCKEITSKVYPAWNIQVIPHGYNQPSISQSANLASLPSKDEVWNVAFIGYITPEKGLPYLQKILELNQHKKKIVFHLFGCSSDKRYNRNRKMYRFHGPYQQKELPQLLKAYHIQLVFLPSMWAETYSYTLSESLIAGLPVLAFDLGAIAERIKELNAGWLLPINTPPTEILTFIEGLTTDRTMDYLQKREHIQQARQKIKSLADMGAEYCALYQKWMKHMPLYYPKPTTTQAKIRWIERNRKQLPPYLDRTAERKAYQQMKKKLKNLETYQDAFQQLTLFDQTYRKRSHYYKLWLKWTWYRIKNIYS